MFLLVVFLLPKVSTFAESTKPNKSNVNINLSLYFLHVKTSLNSHPGTGKGLLWGVGNARPFFIYYGTKSSPHHQILFSFQTAWAVQGKKAREEPNCHPHKVLKFYGTCTKRSPPSSGSLGQLKTGVYRVPVLIMQINNHCILVKRAVLQEINLFF